MPPNAARRRPGRRTIAAALAALAVIGVGGACDVLGYPSGPVFRLVPAAGAPRGGTVAVFLSGDMGFNIGMGPRIAADLARRGMPVLGVNSLSYFAHRRTVADTRALVREATRRALALPGARRVALIGQSFGANALIAGIQGLSPHLRARVSLVGLIVPGDTMALRATPGGLLDIGHDAPALPDARRLDWAPVTCIQGRDEDGSLCASWTAGNVRRVVLPGGHFLHGDTAAVAATLWRALPKR